MYQIKRAKSTYWDAISKYTVTCTTCRRYIQQSKEFWNREGVNWQNKECVQWGMKEIASKYRIWPIIKILYSIETNNWSYLAVPDDGLLNWQNNKLEWLSMKMSTAKIWNMSNHMKIVFNWNKQLILPRFSQQCSIELMKQWKIWPAMWWNQCVQHVIHF